MLDSNGVYNYFRIHTPRTSDLYTCHQIFIKDEELCTDIYNQIMDRLNGDKSECIIRIFHWVNDGLIWQNRGKSQSSMSEGERFVVQNEPMYLAKVFVKLSTPDLIVEYKRGSVEYTDKLGILAEAEKAYQEAQNAE